MADRSDRRRATMFRQRARELAVAAQQEQRFADRRRHLLNLSEIFRRTADELAPQPQEKTLASRGGDRTRVRGLRPTAFRGDG